MNENKEPISRQIIFYLAGLSSGFLGLAVSYIIKDSHPILSKNLKGASMLGIVLEIILVVLNVIELAI